MSDESEELNKKPDTASGEANTALEPTARPTIRSRLSKIKICGFVLVAVALAALLMLSIPKRFTESLVDRLGLIQATLLSAVLALLLAILLSGIVALLWIKFPSLKESWGAYVRILPAGMRDVLRKASAKLALVIAAVAVVLYFALPGTHLWKLARLYWSGPQVDLASPAREKSFQSTINLPWFTYGQDFGVVPV